MHAALLFSNQCWYLFWYLFKFILCVVINSCLHWFFLSVWIIITFFYIHSSFLLHCYICKLFYMNSIAQTINLFFEENEWSRLNLMPNLTPEQKKNHRLLAVTVIHNNLTLLCYMFIYFSVVGSIFKHVYCCIIYCACPLIIHMHKCLFRFW